MTRRLYDELTELHEAYVVAINEAVADGELHRADELAANYDRDSVELVAKREGLTHLLPLAAHQRTDSTLRRLVRRLTPGAHAA
jgi:hypothetical protein